MNHELHIPSKPVHNEAMEDSNEPFGVWARNQVPFLVTQVISILLAVGTFFVYVLEGREKISKVITIDQAEKLLNSLNLVFCIYCVVKLIRVYALKSSGRSTYMTNRMFKRVFYDEKPLQNDVPEFIETTQDHLDKFKLFFLWFWIILTALYLVLTVKSFTDPAEPTGRLLHTEMSERSVYRGTTGDSLVSLQQKKEYFSNEITESGTLPLNSKDKGHKGPDQHNTLVDVLRARWAIMAGYDLNTLSGMFILFAFSVLIAESGKDNSVTSGEHLRKLLKYAMLFAILLIVLYPVCAYLVLGPAPYSNEEINYYSVFSNSVSGVYNAVAYALLIARLDSKLVALPSKLIGVLYLYSAVQPLFLVFDLPGLVSEPLKVTVLVVVFCLKIYFFFIISYAIQKGRIFIYLHCVRPYNERLEQVEKEMKRVNSGNSSSLHKII